MPTAASGREGAIGQRGVRHEHAGAGVAQLEGELLDAVEPVGGGVGGPGPCDGEECDGVVGQVRAVDADHVAVADAPLGEAGGDRVHPLRGARGGS